MANRVARRRRTGCKQFNLSTDWYSEKNGILNFKSHWDESFTAYCIFM
jgi:hypothetical protein